MCLSKVFKAHRGVGGGWGLGGWEKRAVADGSSHHLQHLHHHYYARMLQVWQSDSMQTSQRAQPTFKPICLQFGRNSFSRYHLSLGASERLLSSCRYENTDRHWHDNTFIPLLQPPVTVSRLSSDALALQMQRDSWSPFKKNSSLIYGFATITFNRTTQFDETSEYNLRTTHL